MILDRLPWKAVAEAVSMTGTGIGPGRWISTADVGVTAAVDSITIADRQLAVPWHGRVAVVWMGPESPRVVALDEHEHPLASVQLPDLGQ